MERRRIGGLEVGLVGLGCNNLGGRLDEEQTRRVVAAALDAGVTLFDTADVYGGTRSEEFLGRALAGRRDEAVIATKFGMQVGDDPEAKGGSARWVRRAVEDSLRRLGTDRIDLYQYHFPDPETPVEETLEALDELVRAGKVLQIGNSNFSGAQIAEADKIACDRGAARFVCAQNHYNLLTRDPEQDILPAVVEHGLALLPYFPLASGLLTGKYRRGEAPPVGTRLGALPADRAGRWLTEENFAILEGLTAFAAERGRTVLELAISWLAQRPAVASVIAGATTPEQVRANAAAADWRMSTEDLDEIDRIASPREG